MAAIKGSSVLIQPEPPQSLDPTCRSRKRLPPSGRQIKRSPSSKRFNRSSSQTSTGSELPSASRMFLKYLISKDNIYTAATCRLVLPVQFFRKHKVDQCVTMTDSAEHTLWHMRFQSHGWFGHRRQCVISNGWREFSYDHSLKLNDALVFTMLSSSHFVVEYANSDGSTRAMYPTREGKDYPWLINCFRLECLTSVHLQAVKEKQTQKKAQEEQEKEIREETLVVKEEKKT